MSRRPVKQKQQIRLGLIGSSGHGTATLNEAIGKAMSKHSVEDNSRKAYIGSVRKSGQIVGIFAENGARARALLEEKYGKGNVYLIHRAKDGDIPRG